MKVYPFKIPKPLHDSLVYQVDYGDVFYNKLHQHEDIQLSFIVEGEGTLVVGNSIHPFKKNDIIVIGSNLPHVFKSQLNKGKKSHMLTLFFDKNSFGNDFFDCAICIDSLHCVEEEEKREPQNPAVSLNPIFNLLTLWKMEKPSM